MIFESQERGTKRILFRIHYI